MILYPYSDCGARILAIVWAPTVFPWHHELALAFSRLGQRTHLEPVGTHMQGLTAALGADFSEHMSSMWLELPARAL